MEESDADSSHSSDAETAEDSWEQHPDIWLEDGNVVIVAETTGYRVHKCFLSRRSPIFRDVFSIPQPASLEREVETFSGIPVVYVSDTEHDMSCLLHALYDGRKYLERQVPEIPVQVLLALMRLGHKYDIGDVVDEAAHYLGDFYTPDIRIWRERCDDKRIESHVFAQYGAPDIEVVNAARLTGRPALLPMALYHVCQLALHEITRGAHWWPDNGEPIAQLNDADVYLCLSARERFMEKSVQTVLDLAKTRLPAACQSKSECKKHVERFFLEHAPHPTPNVLHGFDSRFDSGYGRSSWDSVCETCREAVLAKHEAQQQSIWDSLLKEFGLRDNRLKRQWTNPTPLWHVGLPRRHSDWGARRMP